MSIQALSWTLEHSTLTGFDRLVLIALANYCDEHGFAGATKKKLAKIARVSEATVWRSLCVAVEAGELVEADEDCAPQWWLDLKPNRRPRLWIFDGMFSTGVAVRDPENEFGVALGSRRGRAAATYTSSTSSTNPKPLPSRTATPDEKPVVRRPRLHDERPDADCPTCEGSGYTLTADGDATPCNHTTKEPAA